MPPKKSTVNQPSSGTNSKIDNKTSGDNTPQIEGRVTRGRAAAQKTEAIQSVEQTNSQSLIIEKSNQKKQIKLDIPPPKKVNPKKEVPKKLESPKKVPHQQAEVQSNNKKGGRGFKKQKEIEGDEGSTNKNRDGEQQLDNIDIETTLPPQFDIYKNKTFSFQQITPDNTLLIRKLFAEFGGGQMGSRVSCNQTKEIVKCENLEDLDYDLAINYIDQGGAFSISAVLGRLKKIKKFKLDLRDNTICSNGVGAFGNCLSKWANTLEYADLIFSDNRIGKEGNFQFGQSISKCSKLKQLKLDFGSNNFLKENDVKNLMNGISDLHLLKELTLNLKYTTVQNEGAALMGESLSKLKQLVYLDLNLYSTKIQSEGMIDLFANLAKCTSLKTLIIELYNSEDKIDSDGIIRASYEIGKFQVLSNFKIDLSYQPISEEAIGIFVSEVSKCPELKLFQFLFQNSKITLNGSDKFIEGLSNCKNVENLSFCLDFEEGCFEKITSNLYKLLNLTYFQNQECLKKISSTEEIQKIFRNLGKCKKLQSFDLRFQEGINCESLSAIGNEMQNFQSLLNIKLLFSQGNFLQEGVKEFTSGLAKCKQLECINITILESLKDDKAILELARELKQTPQLFELSLEIELGVTNYDDFIAELSSYNKIRRLSIYSNNYKVDRFHKQSSINKLKRKCRNLLSLKLC